MTPACPQFSALLQASEEHGRRLALLLGEWRITLSELRGEATDPLAVAEAVSAKLREEKAVAEQSAIVAAEKLAAAEDQARKVSEAEASSRIAKFALEFNARTDLSSAAQQVADKAEKRACDAERRLVELAERSEKDRRALKVIIASKSALKHRADEAEKRLSDVLLKAEEDRKGVAAKKIAADKAVAELAFMTTRLAGTALTNAAVSVKADKAPIDTAVVENLPAEGLAADKQEQEKAVVEDETSVANKEEAERGAVQKLAEDAAAQKAAAETAAAENAAAESKDADGVSRAKDTTKDDAAKKEFEASCRTIFALCDPEGSHCISVQVFRDCCQKYGYIADFCNVPKDERGCIDIEKLKPVFATEQLDFEAFKVGVAALRGSDCGTMDDDLRTDTIFNSIDVDGGGTITMHELSAFCIKHAKLAEMAGLKRTPASGGSSSPGSSRRGRAVRAISTDELFKTMAQGSTDLTRQQFRDHVVSKRAESQVMHASLCSTPRSVLTSPREDQLPTSVSSAYAVWMKLPEFTASLDNQK
eukprot:TRINITY_DN1645_c0_g1_i1.p1 TRINITY_DN1645_c0_g1~~TRINITY_DN1645_c0_g1_i1.p1  ORF type:complete len:561 (+),score=122.94 TRINITY_DN1645_c0_g1_i1:83-1684(+)